MDRKNDTGEKNLLDAKNRNEVGYITLYWLCNTTIGNHAHAALNKALMSTLLICTEVHCIYFTAHCMNCQGGVNMIFIDCYNEYYIPGFFRIICVFYFFFFEIFIYKQHNKYYRPNRIQCTHVF